MLKKVKENNFFGIFSVNNQRKILVKNNQIFMTQNNGHEINDLL